MFWIAAAGLTALVTAFLVRPIRMGPGSSRRLAWTITGFVPLVSFGLYALLGQPQLTAWRTTPVLPPFIAGAVDKLGEETARHPDDAAAWILLGDVNRRAQRFANAEAAYRRALALQPRDAGLKLSLAETMLAQDGGKVTMPILGLLSASPKDLVSRYYQAMARSQAADWEGALTDWQALRVDLSPDSPLLPSVNARILQAQRVTGAIEDR